MSILWDFLPILNYYSITLLVIYIMIYMSYKKKSEIMLLAIGSCLSQMLLLNRGGTTYLSSWRNRWYRREGEKRWNISKQLPFGNQGVEGGSLHPSSLQLWSSLLPEFCFRWNKANCIYILTKLFQLIVSSNIPVELYLCRVGCIMHLSIFWWSLFGCKE